MGWALALDFAVLSAAPANLLLIGHLAHAHMSVRASIGSAFLAGAEPNTVAMVHLIDN